MPVGFIPPVRFGSTAGQTGVTGTSIPAELNIAGKTDDEIVKLLKNEAPHTYVGAWSGHEAQTTNDLAKVYTPFIANAQGIYMMFGDLYKNYPGDAPRGMVDALTRRYIVTDNENLKGYKRGLGYVNLGAHPLVAQVAALYHCDLGTSGYRYKDLPEAKEAFPVLFQVMDMPDKARAANLLKTTFQAGQGIDSITKIVDKFITDVLPNRKPA